MEDLLLTPASIGYLTQMILYLVVMYYIWVGVYRKSKPTRLLWLFFGFMVLFSLASFLMTSSLRWAMTMVHIKYCALIVALGVLVQFGYHFPELDQRQRLEARIVLALSLLAVCFALGSAVFHLWQMPFPEIPDGSSPVFIIVLEVVLIFWFIVVEIRKFIHFPHAQKKLSDPDNQNLSQRERNFILQGFILASVYLIFLVASLLTILDGYFINSLSMIISVGTLWGLSIFAILYFNFSSESSTFMIKLLGFPMLTILSILGVSGWFIEHGFSQEYETTHPLPQMITYHYEFDNRGRYAVYEDAFNYKEDPGVNLSMHDEGSRQVALPFAFPFSGSEWGEIYVNPNGLISFGSDFLMSGYDYRYGTIPAIVPLLIDMETSTKGNVFTRYDYADRQFTITWYDLSVSGIPDSTLTMQLALFSNGSFHITYGKVDLPQDYYTYPIYLMPQVAGLLLSNRAQLPERINFATDLPFISSSQSGLIEDFFYNFRTSLHKQMLMLVLLVIFSSILILLGFPLFFRYNLLRPLYALIEGVRQVNSGRLNTSVPVYYQDEIGFLATTFNRMVRSIREFEIAMTNQNEELEQRVTQRTMDLSLAIENLEKQMIERERAEESERNQRNLAEALRAAGSALSATLDLDDVLDKMLALIEIVVPYDSGNIMLIDVNKAVLIRTRGYERYGSSYDQTIRLASFEIDRTPSYKQIYTTRQPLIIPDVNKFDGWVRHESDFYIRSWIGAPIIIQGEVAAFVALDKMEPNYFTQEHARNLVAFAGHAAIAIQNARLFEATQNMAIRDALTGCFNRRHFFDIARKELERSHRYGRSISIVMVDVDFFKKINDTFGHLIGDQVLQHVTRLNRQNLRSSDMEGRYGGEEFVYLLPETSLEDARQTAERIRQGIAESSYESEKGNVHVTVSVGVASTDDTEEISMDTLLDQADQAMYIAKKTGRDRVCVWSNDFLHEDLLYDEENGKP